MHTISLDPHGFIHVAFHGDITKTNIVPLAEQLVGMTDDLETRGKLVNMLVDYSDVGNREAGSKPFSVMALRDVNINRFAAFGFNKTSEEQFLEMAKATDKMDKMKVFHSRKEAEKWLSQVE